MGIDRAIQDSALRNAVSGGLIFTIADSLWLAFGVYSLKDTSEPWLAILLSFVALGLLGTALSLRSRLQRQAPDSPSPSEQNDRDSAGRKFAIVNALQGVAIFVAVQV